MAMLMLWMDKNDMGIVLGVLVLVVGTVLVFVYCACVMAGEVDRRAGR